jgi:hypothetical protein
MYTNKLLAFGVFQVMKGEQVPAVKFQDVIGVCHRETCMGVMLYSDSKADFDSLYGFY